MVGEEKSSIKKSFWDKNAGRYDRFMRKDHAAYEALYRLIRPVVTSKTVLELAAGTGLIEKNIVGEAQTVEATDASPEMIAEARKGCSSRKLHTQETNGKSFCPESSGRSAEEKESRTGAEGAPS